MLTGPTQQLDRHLADDLAIAHEALEQMCVSEQRLRERLSQLEAENRRLATDRSELEARNRELVQLNLAAAWLHEARDRGEVLEAIEQIAVELAGAEALALYLLAPDRQRLVPALTLGETGPIAEVEMGQGTIGAAAAGGKLFVAGTEGSPQPGEQVLACAPLVTGGRVAGALAIFGLRPPERRISGFGLEALELLSSHGAAALQAAEPDRLGQPAPQ